MGCFYLGYDNGYCLWQQWQTIPMPLLGSIIQNSGGKKIKVNLTGITAKKFRAFRTTMGEAGDRYKDIGVFEVKDRAINDDLPVRSVTTFLPLTTLKSSA